MDVNTPVEERQSISFGGYSLDDIAHEFKVFAEKHKVEVGSITIDGWGEDLEIVCMRPPTEKEIQKRRAANERAKLKKAEERTKKEKAERAEFERLRNKFGMYPSKSYTRWRR